MILPRSYRESLEAQSIVSLGYEVYSTEAIVVFNGEAIGSERVCRNESLAL